MLLITNIVLKGKFNAYGRVNLKPTRKTAKSINTPFIVKKYVPKHE